MVVVDMGVIVWLDVAMAMAMDVIFCKDGWRGLASRYGCYYLFVVTMGGIRWNYDYLSV